MIETTTQSSRSLQRMVRVLRLNLKGCYFDAIKAGKKNQEFRLAATWEKRLLGKVYDEIHLLRGYPKTGDESRILRRRWNGYRTVTITHPHFGPHPVLVLAIDVTKHPNDKSSATAPKGGAK